jgi:hypothetical protein
VSSQRFDELELTLPEGWETAPHPTRGALLQAFAPGTDGFRSSLIVEVFPRTDDGTGSAPIDDFHESQLIDLARTMTDALVIDDQAAVVDGRPAKSSVIAFRQGPWTISAFVWTVEAPGAAVGVVAMSDSDHAAAEAPEFHAVIESIRLSTDAAA